MLKTHNTYSIASKTGSGNIFIQSLIPENSEDIKGVISIVHGMAEHSDRYLEAAEYFCDNNYAVFMHDHAGHGKSVNSKDDLGFFCMKNGNEKLVDDVNSVISLIKQTLPNKKIIIWGHSMGSFVTRRYIEKYKNSVDGAVICGTSGKNPAAPIGALIADIIGKIKGGKYKSKFIDTLAFGTYNKNFNDGTDFDWLSANKENVQKYIADDFCGFLFSAYAYRDLFKLLSSVSKKSWYKNIPQSFPIYLIAGEDDPVGNFSKGVKEVFNKLKDSGHKYISITIYPELRHEIHNEINRKQVFDDILNFTAKVID